jgi:hypothetical protein
MLAIYAKEKKVQKEKTLISIICSLKLFFRLKILFTYLFIQLGLCFLLVSKKNSGFTFFK